MTFFNRWNPNRQMDDLTRLMDRLWENRLLDTFSENEPRTWGFPVDILETEENYVIKASLPGINPEDLEVTFEDNQLSIRGEVRMEELGEDEQVHLRERRFGRFARVIGLPTHIEADKISAQYDNGVLTLTLPKSEQARPKRISVKPGSSSKVLEGNFENLTSQN